MSTAAYRTSKMRTEFGNEEASGDLDKSSFQRVLGTKSHYCGFKREWEERKYRQEV